jgi:hypothetical protein
MPGASNKKKKAAAGTVWLTLVELVARTTIGFSAIPDRSFLVRSLACEIL